MPIFKTCTKCRKNVEKGKYHKCIGQQPRKKFCNICKMFYNVSQKHVCIDGNIYEDDSKELTTYKWKKKSSYIKRRDGGYCQRCFVLFGEINSNDLTVHHIKSRLNYPELTYDDDNLITVCRSCNSALGTKDELDFKWKAEEYKPTL